MKALKAIPWMNTGRKMTAGMILGLIFGVFFGSVASIFHNGPDLLMGIRESAPWFAAFGAFAGFVLGLEKEQVN